MKKCFTLILLATLSIAASAQTAKKNALKINPLSTIIKTGNIAYERAIASNQSLQLGGFFSGASLGDLNYKGFGFTPEYRYYFAGHKKVMDGVYVAPFARYQQFSIADKSSDGKAKFETLGGGALLGWEQTSRSGFVFDIFLGPSYSIRNFSSGEENNFDIKNGIAGFGLRTGISIGFNF